MKAESGLRQDLNGGGQNSQQSQPHFCGLIPSHLEQFQNRLDSLGPLCWQENLAQVRAKLTSDLNEILGRGQLGLLPVQE